MAEYVQSSEILVFPATRRTYDSNKSRLLSEMALTSIVNKMIDYAGFVITEDISTNGDLNKPFDFNIMGYYFHLDSLSSIIDTVGGLSIGESIWGIIELAGEDYVELKEGDVSTDLSNPSAPTMYHGIKFSKTASGSALGHLITPTAGIYQLQLIKRTADAGSGTSGSSGLTIPMESRVRMSGGSIRIDDGEII